MKTKAITLASIFMLIVANFLSLALYSCSKDEPEEEVVSLVGTWNRTYQSGKDVATEEYTFNSDGKGMWENSYGVWASFKYEITAKNFVSMNMTFMRGISVWRESYNWYFQIKGDTLQLNGKKYVRER